MTASIGPITPPEPALPIPEEPEAVKATLRVAVGEDPVGGRTVAVAEMATLLWQAWAGELAAMGVDDSTFSAVVVGAGNEVWLWVMGDRPYDQLVTSIAGRTIRRLA